jgi:hydrogenase maturation protease
MLKKKILISSVGNLYRRDDGVGVVVLRILASGNKDSNITFFDAGTDGLSLLDQLSSYEKAVIIDAVSMNEPPGVVKLFSPEEAKLKVTKDALSTHGFGLAEVLKLAEELNVQTKIKIIGIEPKDIGFGEGLSDVVKGQIPVILDLVRKDI